MIQRKFYLPQEMYSRLQLQAKITGKTITDILREFVSEGLKRKEKKPAGRGAKALLELAYMAERKNWKGPSDLAKKHDKYFAEAWGRQKARKKGRKKV